MSTRILIFFLLRFLYIHCELRLNSLSENTYKEETISCLVVLYQPSSNGQGIKGGVLKSGGISSSVPDDDVIHDLLFSILSAVRGKKNGIHCYTFLVKRRREEEKSTNELG